jgi:hypothetical protein
MDTHRVLGAGVLNEIQTTSQVRVSGGANVLVKHKVQEQPNT